MTPRVKRIFPRRSGILNMFFTFENTQCSSSCGGGATAEWWNGSAVGERVALGGRAPLTPRQRDDLHATACRVDGFDGRLGEGVGLDGDGLGQLAPAEDLDQAVLVHEALGPQGLGGDLGAVEG